MNVYEHQGQPKQSSTRLLRSKKLSKSTEDSNKFADNDEFQQKDRFSKKIETNKIDTYKKENVEMPIKITSLATIKKDKKKSPEIDDLKEGLQKKLEKRTNIDYAQTDENETLQDISTSFSEEKLDSLPEQMNNETIRKQFQEAFKSMSIVNEEISDQDSSLNGDKKTEVEKIDAKTSFQQVNQMSKTVNALKKEDLIEQDQKEINELKTKEQVDKKDEQNLEIRGNKIDTKSINENNNPILDEIIITNIQKIFTTNLKKEQSEMINKGWVLVESIKEVDEKEYELKKEEVRVKERKEEQGSLQKHESNDFIKKEESKDLIKKQDSKETAKEQESKDSVKKEELKDSIEDKKTDLKEKIIKIDSTVQDQQLSLKKDQVRDEKSDNLIETSIKKTESKSFEKTKTDGRSQEKLKNEKLTSTSSSSSSYSSVEKDSKIPKLSNKNFIKTSSTSSSATSTSSKKSDSKSSPFKKSKTFVLETTIEEKEKQDKVENLFFEAEKLDKTVIFDEDKINIGKIEEEKHVKSDDKLIKNGEVGKVKNEKNQKDKKRLSIVSFETDLADIKSLDAEKGNLSRKKYAKTPIKQLSMDEKEDLIKQLNDEEISVPNDEKDDDSSPQSLNEEYSKEKIRKEKNELIENIDKKLREESIKKTKEIEKNAIKKLVDEQKVLKKHGSKTSINLEDEKTESTKEEIKIESLAEMGPDSVKQEDKLRKKDSKSTESNIKEDKKDEKMAKVDSKSEIIYKKSSIERKNEDISERTAYIENMLRTSGYTEKIIEKANEFINSKDNEKNKEDGVVEEVCVKLVKKNSKDYYMSKKQQVDQDEEKTSLTKSGKDSSLKNTAKKETKASTSEAKAQTATGQNSTGKPMSPLKKSTSLSKIPTLQIPKSTMKKVEIKQTNVNSHKQEDQSKMTNLESSSFKRNCLKPLQTKSEPIQQAFKRPVFKRKKSDLPPKHSIHLNSEEIKKKWNEIKINEKDKLHQQKFYSHLRRTTSNPVISNSFDLLYEVNKMPNWAKEGVANQSKNSKQPQRSNTTSIITQTKRILEKIEKKEIEEVTTRTIINEEEKFTKTSREESTKTHQSEYEETEIS